MASQPSRNLHNIKQPLPKYAEESHPEVVTVAMSEEQPHVLSKRSGPALQSIKEGKESNKVHLKDPRRLSVFFKGAGATQETAMKTSSLQPD